MNVESLQQILSIPKTSNDSLRMNIDSNNEIENASNAASLQSEDWENNDNPWVGRICGKIHEAPSIVFWIQCEVRDVWYNVAPAYVGLNEDKAKFKGLDVSHLFLQPPQCKGPGEVSSFRSLTHVSVFVRTRRNRLQAKRGLTSYVRCIEIPIEGDKATELLAVKAKDMMHAADSGK